MNSLEQNCKHNFMHQAGLDIDNIMWDVFYCTKCLLNVKKERPCPLDIVEIK